MGRTLINGADQSSSGGGTVVFNKAIASTAAWTEDNVFNFTTYLRMVLYIQNLVLASNNVSLRIAGRLSGAGIGANMDRFNRYLRTDSVAAEFGATGETDSQLICAQLDSPAPVYGAIEFWGANPPVAAHVRLDARLPGASLFLKTIGGGNTFRTAIDGFSITASSGNLSVVKAVLVGYTN